MRARELTFFAVAIALHLGLLSLARVAPPSAWLTRIDASARAIEPIEVAIEVAPVVPAPRAEPAPPEAAPPGAEASPTPLPTPALEPRPEDHSVDREPPATAEPVLTAEPTASATPADEYGAPTGPALPGVALAPGVGTPIWALPGILPSAAPPRPASTVTPKAAPTDRDKAGQLLRGTMAANDHKLGLDLPGAGTIAAAVADGVRASDTPAESRSAFVVRLDASGKVVEVRAIRWSAGDPEGYHRAASIAAARLAGRSIAMPGAFASGALVSVEITSLLTLPAGGSGPSRKGSSVSFDLSDVGTKPRRVIRSSYSVRAPG